MGEIADDMMDGFMCSFCGVYFEQEHGYPVACDHCWKELLKQYKTAEKVLEKTGVQKHIEPELS